MESMLFRTGSGSIPVQSPLAPASHRLSVSLSVQTAAAGVVPGEKSVVSSPRISMNMETSRRSIRRSYSESNVARSEFRTLSKLGSRSFTAPRIREVDSDEGTGFPGGGMNKNRNSGGGGGGNGSDGDRPKMGEYYKEMLKSDPRNSLLLGNYAKYLHEVEKDVVKAEEYYGRAILANPAGDGEILSLYGKLIWDTHRDESRAKSYFNQALLASPHDCVIMGSYAHFLWETEEEQEQEEIDADIRKDGRMPIAAMVEAF